MSSEERLGRDDDVRLLRQPMTIGMKVIFSEEKRWFLMLAVPNWRKESHDPGMYFRASSLALSVEISAQQFRVEMHLGLELAFTRPSWVVRRPG
jgi:hypothetical protein